MDTQIEMGGYFELEKFAGEEYHAEALALNCARNCLAYLIEARNITSLWVPNWLCASVDNTALRYNVAIHHYDVNLDFTPDIANITFEPNDYFYVVDYYGQVHDSTLNELANRFEDKLIIDEVMAFFRKPIPNIDTIYSCRKFFGVSDGAYLYTNARIDRELPTDESHARMGFVLGRAERPAPEHYAESSENNKFFATEPIKWMSPITHNILRGIDYGSIGNARQQNFDALANAFDNMNKLAPRSTFGAFMYPLLLENGAAIRTEMQKRRIYVSELWDKGCDMPGLWGRLVRDLLPLICDQRYSLGDMTYESEVLLDITKQF